MVFSVQVGRLIREWRCRRRLSQLELSHRLGVSARHLSFVETGRANASRRLILRLGEQLDIPLRARNELLLLLAGYAPAFGEHSLGAEVMCPVRKAIDTILTGHEPYPCVVLDSQWQSRLRLYRELCDYGPDESVVDPRGDELYVPFELTATDGTELTLVNTLTTFGTPLDITVAGLAMESFFPADDRTARFLRQSDPGASPLIDELLDKRPELARYLPKD